MSEREVALTMRTSCCLNLPPLGSHPTKPPQVSSEEKEEGCWRRQGVVMGVAGTVIGLEMVNLVSGAQVEAVAAEIMASAAPAVSISERRIPKWSEKRACPAWRRNTLETIVPENLPRPAARRRYEAVGYSYSKPAPPISVAVKTMGNCFSM